MFLSCSNSSSFSSPYEGKWIWENKTIKETITIEDNGGNYTVVYQYADGSTTDYIGVINQNNIMFVKGWGDITYIKSGDYLSSYGKKYFRMENTK